MDVANVTDLFAGVAFPVAVSAFLLVKTTGQLDELTRHTLKIAEAVDRMEQREAARHERL